MTGPPYQRIIADLRRRITEGELRPGDRVPSTRQIAIRWGVALATATKALTALRQEGLVRTVPRVGTVVAEPQPAPASTVAARAPDPAGAPRELTRERIVQVAIEAADAEGLAALSMRGIAARLGAATMSTYRHVAGKDDLVVLMADAAFGELPPAADDGSGWRAQVEGTLRTLWTLHRRHPWLAQLSPLTRPLPLPRLLAHSEQILAALGTGGLDPVTAFDLQVLLYSYVQGLAANIEWEAHAQATTGLSSDEWMQRQGPAMGAIAATGRYPAFSRLMAGFAVDGYDLELDRIFELGLQLMLDGLTPLIER